MSVFGVFLSLFSRIRSEYRNLHGKSPYLVEMRENEDQKNSEDRQFADSTVYNKSVFHKYYSPQKLYQKNQFLPINMKFVVIYLFIYLFIFPTGEHQGPKAASLSCPPSSS